MSYWLGLFSADFLYDAAIELDKIISDLLVEAGYNFINRNETMDARGILYYEFNSELDASEAAWYLINNIGDYHLMIQMEEIKI